MEYLNLNTLKPGEGKLGIVKRVERVCPIHGKYTSIVTGRLRNGKYVDLHEAGCKKCRDLEYKKKTIAEYENSKWNKAFEKSGIPEISKENKINNYEVKSQEQIKARQYVIDWVNHKNRNIILTGKTRTGKTHLLVGALRGAAMYGNSIQYVLETDLVLKIKDSYTNLNSSEYKIQEEYSNYDYLVIDEIGRASGTEKDKQIIRNLIIKRFNNKKSTAIASNLKLGDFNDYFGDVVYGKFRSSCFEINCVWESYENEL